MLRAPFGTLILFGAFCGFLSTEVYAGDREFSLCNSIGRFWGIGYTHAGYHGSPDGRCDVITDRNSRKEYPSRALQSIFDRLAIPDDRLTNPTTPTARAVHHRSTNLPNGSGMNRHGAHEGAAGSGRNLIPPQSFTPIDALVPLPTNELDQDDGRSRAQSTPSDARWDDDLIRLGSEEDTEPKDNAEAAPGNASTPVFRIHRIAPPKGYVQAENKPTSSQTPSKWSR